MPQKNIEESRSALERKYLHKRLGSVPCKQQLQKGMPSFYIIHDFFVAARLCLLLSLLTNLWLLCNFSLLNQYRSFSALSCAIESIHPPYVGGFWSRETKVNSTRLIEGTSLCRFHYSLSQAKVKFDQHDASPPAFLFCESPPSSGQRLHQRRLDPKEHEAINQDGALLQERKGLCLVQSSTSKKRKPLTIRKRRKRDLPLFEIQ